MKTPGNRFSWGGCLRLILLLVFVVSTFATLDAKPVQAAAAGFSEYYIPGSVDQLFQILKDIDNNPDLGNALGGGGTCTVAPCNRLHNVITITVASDGTTIYYDHWENGYGTGSIGADETYIVNRGDVLVFDSPDIPVPRAAGDTCVSTNPNGNSTSCYDGRDRIYVAGGGVSVAQAFWPEVTGTVFSNAWEVYPVKPYETHYTIPVGEDLSGAPLNYTDFTQTYLIVQATQDNTAIQIDDPGTVGIDVNVTLNRGEVTQLFHFDAGTTVQASAPVQTQFIVGRFWGGFSSDSRSFTSVPDSLWASSYYSPIPSSANGYNTDLFIYNPTGTALDINYEDALGSGTVSVPANSTRSYQDLVGRYVPQDSAVFLSAADNTTRFWAIGSVSTESADYNYGFPMIPSTELSNDYYLSWAPGTTDLSDNGSPVFVTPTTDNTTIFVDYSPTDGVVDATYTVDRIETLKIFDPDRNNTGMHIFSTSLIALVWGEDPDTAATSNPYIDAGYTIIPLKQEWIDAALILDKTVDPTMINASTSQVAIYTLATKTDQFGLQDVFVVDDLPAEWGYVPGNTIITLPNGSTISGAAADPDIAGQRLTWNRFPAAPLDMNANETLTIQFQAETISTPTQDFYINEAISTGTNGIETFSASDIATAFVSSLVIDKVSSAGGTVNPGDAITYTVNITNKGGTSQNNIVVSDPLPIGTTYVPASTVVNGFTFLTQTLGDAFNAIAFTGDEDSNGPGVDPSWSPSPGAWIELGEADGANAGSLQVVTDLLNDYVLRVQNSNRGVARTADLSACASATLSLTYRREALDDAGDNVRLSIGTGGTITDILNDFIGPTNDTVYQSYSVDITPWIDTQTRIQLQASATLGATDNIFFDDILISCELPSAVIKDNTIGGSNPDFTSGPPPALISAGDNFDLAPGATMIIAFQVTVNDPVPFGQIDVVNTVSVTSDEQVEPLTDSVTDVLPALGAITGTVWEDTNNDGVGDTPIGGVVLELLDEFGDPIDGNPNTPGIQPVTTVTNSNGTYSFTNVPPGNYFVRETQPAGYGSVSDKDGGNPDLIGDMTPITVVSGQTNSGNDFVEIRTSDGRKKRPVPSPSPTGGAFLVPVTGFAPNVVTDLSNEPYTIYADTSITLDIPALSVNIPIVGVPKKDGTWNVSWLTNQAGWLEGSAFPSWNGNSVLTGHVYLSNGKPGPFVKLHELKTGDQVIVHAFGLNYIFEVQTNAIISPTDRSVIKHEERPWITLVTCTDYDPKTSTYKSRFIVRAVLVKVTAGQ